MKLNPVSWIEVVVVLALILIAISTGVTIFQAVKGKNGFVHLDGTIYRIVVMDGCEYLKNYYHPEQPLLHKGNCTNAVHNQRL